MFALAAGDRAPGKRQVDARAAFAGYPAAAVRRRHPRDRRDRIAGGRLLARDPGRASVSCSAPHGQRCRAGRRRQQSAAGRSLAGPPWRAVPRRIARMGSPRARRTARAARVGRDPHFTRGAAAHVPDRVSVRRGTSLRAAGPRPARGAATPGQHWAAPDGRACPPASGEGGRRNRCAAAACAAQVGW